MPVTLRDYSSTADCGICKATMEQTDSVIHTGAQGSKHPYHRGCLDAWLRISNTCPTCRVDIQTVPLEGNRVSQLADITDLPNQNPFTEPRITTLGSVIANAFLGISSGIVGGAVAETVSALAQIGPLAKFTVVSTAGSITGLYSLSASRSLIRGFKDGEIRGVFFGTCIANFLNSLHLIDPDLYTSEVMEQAYIFAREGMVNTYTVTPKGLELAYVLIISAIAGLALSRRAGEGNALKNSIAASLGGLGGFAVYQCANYVAAQAKESLGLTVGKIVATALKCGITTGISTITGSLIL